jgi:hypothetical protein
MNQYVALLNARNAPIDTPRSLRLAFCQIQTDFIALQALAVRLESLQRIGAADQGARSSKPLYCALPLLVR